MHTACSPLLNGPVQGDAWLSTEIPKLTNSLAFQNNGAIFITWDESSGGNSAIGMIVLSPLAKGGGYQNSISYSHSSTLRTFQEIFNVTPFLGDAANATDLSDLFVAPVVIPPGFRVNTLVKPPGGPAQLGITGATLGKTNLLQWSPDLGSWSTFATNVVVTNNYPCTDPSATNADRRYYRAVQLP